jgi:hypothetical protein
MQRQALWGTQSTACVLDAQVTVLTCGCLSLCRMWFSVLVAVIYIIVGVMACIGAVRSIVLNAVNYSLFANL